MKNFRRTSDDESEDEITTVILQVSDDESSAEEDSESEDEAAMPGPSTLPSVGNFPEWVPSDDDDEEESDDASEDDDDPLIQAIKSAKERRRQHPPDIVFKNHVTDLSFHPGEEIVAVASISGDVFLYKYGLEENELLETIEVHSKACRAVEYSNDGDYLVSCGKEKTVMVTDTTTNKLRQFYDDAHESPPFCLYILNENIVCSGDEGGVMKVWDVRQKAGVSSFKVGDEQISSIISNGAGRHIVCCASDCITAYDFNSRKLYAQSEPYDSELTSMGLFKQESKLVVSTIKGSLYVFNWGQFGYHTDVYHGPKFNINSTLAITESVIVTACGDGVIRAANLFPHKQLGVVGQHTMSVEKVDITHDGEYIASIGFDEVLKFWDIRYFEDIRVKPEKTKKTDAKNNLPSSKVRNPGDFFADLTQT